MANCDLSVYGPNGFFREFKGSVSGLRSSQLDIVASYDTKNNKITLTMKNTAAHDAKVSIANQYSGKSTKLTIKAGATGSKTWSLNSVSGWYDLTVGIPAKANADSGGNANGIPGRRRTVLGA
jgi:phospholipase C